MSVSSNLSLKNYVEHSKILSYPEKFTVEAGAHCLFSFSRSYVTYCHASKPFLHSFTPFAYSEKRLSSAFLSSRKRKCVR